MGAPTGFLLLDKPAGWSSHRVVSRVRRLLSTRKVGHAGTLDPMATGLLVVGVGPCTRLLTFAVGLGKTYTATIRLGASTPTDDADSSPDTFAVDGAVSTVDAVAVEEALSGLRGEIQQVPSAVSAIKVDGKRAYARVRAGEDVMLTARPVTVFRFELVSPLRSVDVTDDEGRPHRVLDVDAVVDCSSGTYIRALARDLGAALGVHGHLTALRRTHVGGFSLDEAHAVPDFEEEAQAPALMSPADAARRLMPILPITREQAVELRQGRFLTAGGAQGTDLPAGGPAAAAVVDAGDLVAVVDREAERIKPRAVFPA